MSYSEGDLRAFLGNGGARIKSVNETDARECPPVPSASKSARKKPAFNLVGRVQGGKILSIAFTVPLKVVSEANQHEHWTKKHHRNQDQQSTINNYWPLSVSAIPVALPCSIELTRIGIGRMDSDNLAGAFKHVRDAIARLIGVDDGSDLIEWRYAQRASDGYSIEIRISARENYE